MIKAYAKTRLQESRSFLLHLLLCLILAFLLSSAGCTTSTRFPSAPSGPSAAVPGRHEPWDPKYPRSTCIVTGHYRIFTDIVDPEALDQLTQLMEGAFNQYRQLSPAIPLSSQPLRSYIFARRDQWASFTAQNTGADAAIYLKINRGAYTVDDWFVAFWLGDRGTFAVAAHEGFHQFVARNYAGRIPPAIEEGIACMFEDIEFVGRLPQWNIGASPSRRRMLATAMSTSKRWPLDQLLRMHAGDVIGLPRQQIDTFYAQTWALAMFLWEADNNRYRPAFQQYLADIAAGQAYRPADLAHLSQREWNPAMAGPQLSHYLNLPLSEITTRYERYCHTLAHSTD